MTFRAITVTAPAAGVYDIAVPGPNFLGYSTTNTPAAVGIVLPDGQYIPLPRNAPNFSVPGRPFKLPPGTVIRLTASTGVTVFNVNYDDE